MKSKYAHVSLGLLLAELQPHENAAELQTIGEAVLQRVALGAPALQRHPGLDAIAADFSHGGRAVQMRLAVDSFRESENLTCNFGHADHEPCAMVSWLKSPAHRF